MSVQPLNAWQICIAAGLVVLSGALSLLFRLRLEKQLAIGAARTVVQLLLVGIVLGYIFAVRSPWLVLAVALVMVAFACQAAVGRSKYRYPGMAGHAFLTLATSGILISCLVTRAVIEVHPWYRPQYVIPLLGMTLGNSLTAVSIAIDSLLAVVTEQRGIIEMELSHGASAWEAALGPMRTAARLGMLPTINAMMVVGIVSLPGMMTGQILAGNNPVEAVKYQIVVMFMLAAASAVSCIAIVLLAFRRLFNDHQQLTRAVAASSR